MCQVFETVKECATHTHTWAHTHTNKFQQSRGHKSCPMSVTENLNSQAHCTHVPSVVLCNFPSLLLCQEIKTERQIGLQGNGTERRKSWKSVKKMGC